MAAEQVSAFGGAVQAADDIHQGAFARAAGSGYGHVLAGLDHQIDASQGLDGYVAAGLGIDFPELCQVGDGLIFQANGSGCLGGYCHSGCCSLNGWINGVAAAAGRRFCPCESFVISRSV